MLKELVIDNLALIKHLQLSFLPSMTCLTGETGAGKSIMLDAIELVLGGKCNQGLIKDITKPVNICASFEVDYNSQTYDWLVTNKFIEPKDTPDIKKKNITGNKATIISITRSISINNNKNIKSKALINKLPASISQVKELGHYLIYIHGQHEHLNLLKEQNQLKILDSYGKLTSTVAKVNNIYKQWAEDKQLLNNKLKSQAEYQSKKQLLEFQIEELQNAELKPNEWQDINQQYQWLANQQQYIEQLNQANIILEEGDDQQQSVSALLNNVINIISNITPANKNISNIIEFMNNALIQSQEASVEISDFLNNLNTDPELLNKLDKRISQLHELARKHKTKPELLLSLLEQCEQELTNLDSVDTNITKLKAQIEKSGELYIQQADILSEKRNKTANKLSKELTSLLKKLRMEAAEFSILLQANNNNEPKPHGHESVVFLIKTNSDHNMQALAQGTSGGELSRVALAIQVATAQVEGTPSLIFDEVDVGIGGGTAEIVGKLLRTMASSTQVMCITHLAQVAAQAEHHIKVSKAVVNNETVTSIEFLDKSKRVAELSRMIGGLTITKQTEAHAKELLEQAQEL